jgi:hypothetical protein
MTERLDGDNLPITTVGSVSKSFNLSSLEHDVYLFTAQAFAQVTGSNAIIASEILTHKLACFKADINSPLLAVKIPDVTE